MSTWSGLFESPDGGVTWYSIGENAAKIDQLAPLNTHTVLGSVLLGGIYISRDGGSTWAPYNQNLNSYLVDSLQFYNNTLYAGTNGGVNQVWVDPTQ